MCKVFEFKGRGASFASRLTPAARLHYKAGAGICYRIENHKRVQLRYAIEEFNEIDAEIRERWSQVVDLLTAKQYARVQGWDIFAQAESAKRVTKSNKIQHLLHYILCDEPTYRARKQWMDECRAVSKRGV